MRTPRHHSNMHPPTNYGHHCRRGGLRLGRLVELRDWRTIAPVIAMGRDYRLAVAIVALIALIAEVERAIVSAKVSPASYTCHPRASHDATTAPQRPA
jgi:hypothetical protein